MFGLPPVHVPQRLRDAIVGDPADELASRLLFDRIPFIFENDWDSYRAWRNRLSEMLLVDAQGILITGSACVGYSLNPRKSLGSFHDESDVDVAVISPYHFDVAWRALRGTRMADLVNARERQALKDHQTRYVYFGCIATDRLVNVLPFHREWTLAAAEMSGTSPTEGRDVSFRLYRDYESLRSYQIVGIKELQSNLLDAA